MNRKLVVLLLCSAGMLSAGAARADGADPCAIDTKVRADGMVELSNIGHSSKCEVAPASRAAAPALPPAPPAAPDAPKPLAAQSAPANPGVAPSDPATAPPADQKDRRENYRDAVLAGAPGTAVGNPAVSRRYKMMDKATYQDKVLNGAAPQSDAASPGSQ